MIEVILALLEQKLFNFEENLYGKNILISSATTSNNLVSTLERLKGYQKKYKKQTGKYASQLSQDAPPKPGRTLHEVQPLYKNQTETYEGEDKSLSRRCERIFKLPDLQPYISPESFSTFLISPENKPLERGVIQKITNVLLDSGPVIIANHITRVDLEFVRHLEDMNDFGLGVRSGLEFLTLPQADLYRRDFFDRYQCFILFISTSILTCNDEQQRAEIILKWIKTAIELKTALGNILSFSAIISSLSSPQISRLSKTWSILRQKHTKIALTFEAKLKGTLKEIKAGNEPLAPNTTMPYVISLIETMEKHAKLMETSEKEITDTDKIRQNFKVSFFVVLI